MNIKIQQADKYAPLVNFKNNKIERIHRWFYIKEGYSKELISYLLDNLKIKNGYIVDFFNGSGTTALVAKEKGLKYYGFEVNPFLHLLSKVKLLDYSQRDLEEIQKNKINLFNNLENGSEINNINLNILKNVFRENFIYLTKARNLIFDIKREKIKNFFIIALSSILEDVGYSKKDGNGLKYPKNKKAGNFIKCLSEKIDFMISDIIKCNYNNSNNCDVILSDSRNIAQKQLNILTNNTSLVVFSPPYANCFDYAETYKLELWVSGLVKSYNDLKFLRNASLSSHLNKDLNAYKNYDLLENDLKALKEKAVWSKKIYKMLSGYFFDMEKILTNSYNILLRGGYCVVVVGNSAYGGHIIETDKILSKIAIKIGFKEVNIQVARKLRSSPQQTKLLKNNSSLRESVIIMRKNL